jgi:RNAse (barnase) inhibitor barstar
MMLGSLSVHFATQEAADSLRNVTAVRIAEIAGGPSLFGELATALELPDDFGHNWDALDESLRELETDVPLVLVIRNGAMRWQRAPEEMQALVDVWLGAAAARDHDLHLVFVW